MMVSDGAGIAGAVVDRGRCGRAVLEGGGVTCFCRAIFGYRELISRYREIKHISRYRKINCRYPKIISRYREIDYFPISEIDFPISGIQIPDIGK